MRLYKGLFIILFLLSAPTFAAMKIIYHAPESTSDTRYNFHWEVLRSCLDITTKKYGAYELSPSVFMTEDRQVTAMEHKDGHLTVMIRETNKRYEEVLQPVRIPIDRNLIGYRVLLVRKDKEHLFKKVQTLQDLVSYSLGQGKGWGDISILQDAGFRVISEVYYDDLFKFLNFGKYDAFPRGVTEVQDEFKTFGKIYPQLTIEKTILLYYPLPTYFWFHKSPEGKQLAQRVEEGFRTILKNGTYQKIFNKYYAAGISALGLKKRKIIKIENAYLPNTVPFKDADLWYDPLK